MNKIPNQLYYGDNLDILRRYIKSESVDLIYLDPPFNSAQDYNVLFAEHSGERAAAQIKAFEDTWKWDMAAEEAFADALARGGRIADLLAGIRGFLGESDMMAYLAMMAPRLIELHRVLKPTGSIYLHCDPTASHYLKLLMDAVFGPKMFRNEIVWDYSFRLMDLPRFFNRKHDLILFYAKSKDAYFKMPKTAWTKEELLASRKQAIHLDDNGEEWIWMPGGRGHSKNKLRKIDEIIAGGKAMSDVWQIPIISSSSHERLGYPTQKPEALLERILSACSKEGDVVLDPFCGCGTAVAVAQRLKRRWIGIDITHLAIGLIKHRLKDTFGRFAKYEVIGEPTSLPDAQTLAIEDRFQFQWWALGLVGARPVEQKKGADKGIDGQLYFQDELAGKPKQVLFSVKSGKVGVRDIRDLRGVIDRENAAIGALISLESPTAPMTKEAAAAGFYESPGWNKKYPRVQLLTIEELLGGAQINMPPTNITFKKAVKSQYMVRETQSSFVSSDDLPEFD